MAHKKTKRVTSKKAASPVEPELAFFAKDFPHHPKNPLWFMGIALLAIAILALLFQAREYLLMLVVVAILLALFRLAHLEPRQHQVKINHRGVTWGDTFHPYFHLRAFWVARSSEGTTHVYIERLNFSPTVHFIIPENRIEELVSYLSDYLPWHFHRDELLSDRVNRFLRL